MERMRKLTSEEIEYVLSAISNFRFDETLNLAADTYVFEALRANLRPSLRSLEIVDEPNTVECFRGELRMRYLSALQQPFISEGARSASANSEFIIQNVLKAAQSAGAKDTGNPIRESLSMKSERVVEYIYSAVLTYAPEPEWYLNNAHVPRAFPPTIDDVLLKAISTIQCPMEALIIKGSRGEICTTKMKGRHLVNEIQFSMVETLKYHRTPYHVLQEIDRYVTLQHQLGNYQAETNVSVECAADYATYKIIIESSDPTIGFSLGNLVAEIGNSTDVPISFEIFQMNVTSLITSCVEINAAKLGLLRPRKIVSGASGDARVWELHMNDPMVMIPVKNLCLFLRKIGLRIIGCSRNTTGKCNFLRVAEHDVSVAGNLMDWFSSEVSRISEIEKAQYVPKSNVRTWRDPSGDGINDFATFRMIRYRGGPGSSEAFAEILYNETNEFATTYTNLVPRVANIFGTSAASQAMEIEWVNQVAGSKGTKVSQYALDTVTLYGCRMGTVLQMVKQSAANIGGPLATMNENPHAVLTNAALNGKSYTTRGGQSEIVTGSASLDNGPTSARICVSKVVSDISNSTPAVTFDDNIYVDDY